VAFVIVRVTFKDYAEWRKVFEEAGSLRKASGSKGVRVLRDANKPNEAVIFGEYEDLERARQFFQSPEFRQATQRAGLTAPPQVEFLEDAGQLPA
jgi:heme-degrading monooxygenase HmoA